MRRLALATLTLSAVLAPLAGCRDAVVDPLPAAPEPPVFEDVRAIYLKGPAELRVGAEREFRGEPLPEAVRYAYEAFGDGRLIERGVVDEIGRIRVFAATTPGEVTLFVRAYDAAGHLAGSGSKTVRVTR